jgi:hypothetical protein
MSYEVPKLARGILLAELKSGRIEASSIATAILSVGTPRCSPHGFALLGKPAQHVMGLLLIKAPAKESDHGTC